MGLIDGYLAAWERFVRDDFSYCNETWLRCSDPNCADCSTGVGRALVEGGLSGFNACTNSFALASLCFNAKREDWFIQRFGPGQGTFISAQQALHVVSWGFVGSSYGMAPRNGHGHIETSIGNGYMGVGAHSHATGVGYRPFLSVPLDYFAVPPMFLAEMAPPLIDAATLAAIKKLHDWQLRRNEDDGTGAHGPLVQGETSGDVAILNQLLLAKGVLANTKYMNTYTRYTRSAVHNFKKARGLPNTDGKVFGAIAAEAILTPR